MTGNYYRLLNPFTSRHSAWIYVSEDKNKALVYYAVKEVRPANETVFLKLKGLDENAGYKINGKTLMNYGIVIDINESDCYNIIIRMERV